MANVRIERFDKNRHLRTGFSCGVASLDEFLMRYVSQYEKRRLGRTYVAVDDQEQVLGYFTLAASAIDYQHAPKEMIKHLPKHPIPCMLIARLAVDEKLHGQGLGRDLLTDALRICWELSQRTGIHLVEVEAINEEARAFYQKHGFSPLPEHPLRLFITMDTLSNVFDH